MTLLWSHRAARLTPQINEAPPKRQGDDTVLRRASSLLDHIPLQLHPQVRALAITLFMVTVNLGYAWLIRRALAALFASARFVDEAEKHGASRALRSALWRGRLGRSRVRHAAILIAGAVGYGFGTLVVAGYILQLATLEHTAHGFTKTHLQPLLARLLVAGYLIGPAVMFTSQRLRPWPAASRCPVPRWVGGAGAGSLHRTGCGSGRCRSDRPSQRFAAERSPGRRRRSTRRWHARRPSAPTVRC